MCFHKDYFYGNFYSLGIKFTYQLNKTTLQNRINHLLDTDRIVIDAFIISKT